MREPSRLRCVRSPRPESLRQMPTEGVEVGVTGLSWRPLRRLVPVLSDLNLHVEPGQRVLITGPSGSGKSTLLRAIAGLLTPALGELTGTTLLDGIPPTDCPGAFSLVLQDPASSRVAETVGRDVAFGPENLGMPRDEIWPRVHDALAAAHFPYPTTHATSHLSGGEAQRLSLAGALAMRSRLLLLDEPTSMLDPLNAEMVRSAVRDHVTATGSTLIIVDHHVDEWVDYVDRLVVLNSGGDLIADGRPEEILRTHATTLAAEGVWVPSAGVPTPLEIPSELVEPATQHGGELMTATDIVVQLRSSLTDRRTKTDALRGVSAAINTGECLTLTGSSGAGKSTLLAVLAALQQPTSGEVRTSADLAAGGRTDPFRWRSRELVERIAWVSQRPELGFVRSTVIDEVMASGRSCHRQEADLRNRCLGLLEVLGLSRLADSSPYQLSGGEQRRLSIASSLAHGAVALLFDEPTVGQDRATWAAVTGAMQSAAHAGAAVAVASHDVDAVEAIADRRLRLDAGVVA